MNKSKRIINVASYPKSGATFFRFLMYACRFEELEQSGKIGPFYPDIIKEHVVERNLGKGHKFFVKSHYPYFKSHPYLEYIDTCVYIVRHPINCFLSRVNHYILEGGEHLKNNFSKEKLIKELIKEGNLVQNEIDKNRIDGGWNNHVLSWLRTDHGIPIILIKYEDLVKDTKNVVKMLNKSLDLNLTERAIEKGITLSSFENMKKLEHYELENEVPGMFYSEKRKAMNKKHGVSFVNKGTLKVKKEELQSDTLELIYKELGETIEFLDYN